MTISFASKLKKIRITLSPNTIKRFLVKKKTRKNKYNMKGKKDCEQ